MQNDKTIADNMPVRTDLGLVTGNNSVESRAQREDADAIATATEPGEILNIYRLIPVAREDDPRRDKSPLWQEVIVAARTTGDARIVAAGAEVDFTDVDALPAEDVSTTFASMFRDEKAYTVVEVEHGRTGLRRGVISGSIPPDTIKSTQI
ncbi:hypothetical protein G6L28_15120 [Agrobacterium larrymoorei]|uniref:hypothetical protein n=1 Tax=Agrobacterium larrymoorei TaxID=160699 RepID=UPI001572C408|nr:hypothetical protein [Agrobacterium larrymoorei]NTJ43930.1 hypothetical protein [Agrobacterium larrymoorei]